MIASLRGTVQSRSHDLLVVEVSGVGYEVHLTPATASRLPETGQEVMLHVVQSFGMYGGGETLYGFLTLSEKAMFLAFKDNISGTGAKKALEHLEKASKSLPDFRRAIIEKDVKILFGVFGFTKKTAAKLVDALKDRLESVPVSGPERLIRADRIDTATGPLSQALNALSALGYKPSEARVALQTVTEENSGEKLGVEQILRLALKRL